MQHVDYIDTKPQEGTKRGRVRAQVSFFHGLLLIVLEYDTALTWLMIVESYNGTLALLPWEIHSGISPVWRHFPWRWNARGWTLLLYFLDVYMDAGHGSLMYS